MTGDPPAAGGVEEHRADLADVHAVLLAVRESALRLATGFDRPPATLRVQAGDVLVEVAWGTELPGPPAPDGDAAAVAAGAGGPEGEAPAIRSPTVGRFYRSPQPGAPPFADVGDVVTPGQQVAIVETMKLMIPVQAEEAGTIVEVLQADGADVEHGEALFALAPS